MLAQPPYDGNNPRQYCPPHSPDEINEDLDRLEAKLDRADALIAEALRPEPVDWQRHFHDLLTEAAEEGRRRAARMEGGA